MNLAFCFTFFFFKSQWNNIHQILSTCTRLFILVWFTEKHPIHSNTQKKLFFSFQLFCFVFRHNPPKIKFQLKLKKWKEKTGKWNTISKLNEKCSWNISPRNEKRPNKWKKSKLFLFLRNAKARKKNIENENCSMQKLVIFYLFILLHIRSNELREKKNRPRACGLFCVVRNEENV